MAMVPKGLAAWFPGVEKKVAISDKKLLKTPEKAKEENTQEPQASAPPLPAPPSEEKKVAQESQASALSLPAPPSGKKKKVAQESQASALSLPAPPSETEEDWTKRMNQRLDSLEEALQQPPPASSKKQETTAERRGRLTRMPACFFEDKDGATEVDDHDQPPDDHDQPPKSDRGRAPDNAETDVENGVEQQGKTTKRRKTSGKKKGGLKKGGPDAEDYEWPNTADWPDEEWPEEGWPDEEGLEEGRSEEEWPQGGNSSTPLKKSKGLKKKNTKGFKKEKKGRQTETTKGVKPVKKGLKLKRKGSMKSPADRPEISVDLLPSPIIPTSMTCGRCKQVVDPTRAQLIGKCAGSWRCNACNSKGVQLSRLPEWKGFTNVFKDFPEDAKQRFWEQVKAAAGQEALKQVITETITTRTTEQKKATAGGGYYPLSYYKRQGFNVKKIKLHCRDTKLHSIFGKTYRVVIDKVEEGSLEEKMKEKAYSGTYGVGGSSSSTDLAGQAGSANPPGLPVPIAGVKDLKQLQKEKSNATKSLAKLAIIMIPYKTTLKHKADKSVTRAPFDSDRKGSPPLYNTDHLIFFILNPCRL